MGNQNNVNVFGTHSVHFEPRAKHRLCQSRVYSPEEFLAMPMVQDFIKNNPDQFFIHEETGETLFAQKLAELYASVNNGKKLKKALRRSFGDKA